MPETSINEKVKFAIEILADLEREDTAEQILFAIELRLLSAEKQYNKHEIQLYLKYLSFYLPNNNYVPSFIEKNKKEPLN